MSSSTIEYNFACELLSILSGLTHLHLTLALDGSTNLKYKFICEQYNLKLFDLRFLQEINPSDKPDPSKCIIFFEISIINHELINQRLKYDSYETDSWGRECVQDISAVNNTYTYLQIPELLNSESIARIIDETNKLCKKHFARPITTITGNNIGANFLSTLYMYQEDPEYKEPEDPVNRDTILEESRKGNIDFCKKYIKYVKKYSDATSNCAKSGNLECLQFLFSSGCRTGCDFYRSLFSSKNLECVKWCFENNIIIDHGNLLQDVCVTGNLEIFLYLLSMGCRFDTKILERCVDTPDIEQWIKENYHVDKSIYDDLLHNVIFSRNLTNDELKIKIQSCLDKGGSWQPYTIYYHYVLHRGIDICQYLYDLGCPMSGCEDEFCYQALQMKNYDLFNWFVEKGVEYNTEQLLEEYACDEEIRKFLLQLPKCDGQKMMFFELC